MRMIRWAVVAALVALIAAAPGFAEDKVDIQVMKYNDLIKLIEKNKGKVVVVDFWQDFCITCSEMPKLIELKKKYGDDLVAITVNLDDPNDKKFSPATRRPFIGQEGDQHHQRAARRKGRGLAEEAERHVVPDDFRVQPGREIRVE